MYYIFVCLLCLKTLRNKHVGVEFLTVMLRINTASLLINKMLYFGLYYLKKALCALSFSSSFKGPRVELLERGVGSLVLIIYCSYSPCLSF